MESALPENGVERQSGPRHGTPFHMKQSQRPEGGRREVAEQREK